MSLPCCSCNPCFLNDLDCPFCHALRSTLEWFMDRTVDSGINKAYSEVNDPHNRMTVKARHWISQHSHPNLTCEWNARVVWWTLPCIGFGTSWMRFIPWIWTLFLYSLIPSRYRQSTRVCAYRWGDSTPSVRLRLLFVSKASRDSSHL